jgi:hypothetical protein
MLPCFRLNNEIGVPFRILDDACSEATTPCI